MKTEILEGSIEPVEPWRLKGKYAVFSDLKFLSRDGMERNLKNICSGGDVTGLLRQGGSGRFYLSSAGGQTGIHGVRLDDGTEAYSHYNNMEFIVSLGIAAGAAVLAFGLATNDIMILPVLIGMALVGALFYFRSNRLAAKRQFDADAPGS